MTDQVRVKILDLALRKKFGATAVFNKWSAILLRDQGKLMILDLCKGRVRRRHKRGPLTRQEAVERVRRRQLLQNVPDVFQMRTILNIGAYEERFHFAANLKATQAVVDVLELDKKRCQWLQTQKWINQVINGDVRHANKLLPRKYDLILWSHGPALLPAKDVGPTINLLWHYANVLFVIMTPWGAYRYKGDSILRWVDRNKTALYEDDFKALGFETNTIGRVDSGAQSNLLAWRRR